MNSSLTERIAGLLLELGQALTPADDPRGASSRALLRAVATGSSPTLFTVAAAAGIAKSTASELVGSLEDDGLLRRERAAGDRRRLALKLTPRGRRALAAQPPLATDSLAAALGSLTSHESENFEHLLGKVAAALAAPAAPDVPATTPAALTVPPTADVSDRRLLVVSVEGGELGLPLERVREVVPYATPRRIATSSPWLAGVIPVRGTLYPVCRLAERLGFPVAELDGAGGAALVLVDGPDGPAALAVAAIAGLALAPAAGITPPLGGGVGVSGIADLGDRLVVLLDLDELLAD